MKTKPLSLAELRVWHAFKHAGEGVFDRVVREVAAETGLSAGDYGVLSRLTDLGSGALRQQELAQSMRWDKTRLSHHLTRMEQRGLVRRQHLTPREVLVEVTASGATMLAETRPVHAAAVRRHLLDQLNDEEIEILLRVFERLSSK